jgi:hypothetical protein
VAPVRIFKENSEMRRVLELCLIAFPETTGGRIAAAKADFNAWKKRNDIEADIVRLKERVHACHLRFTVCILNVWCYSTGNRHIIINIQTIASARIEHTSTRIAQASARIEHTLLALNNEQASARIEHALLVLNSEQRERLSRMENMVARLLVDTQVHCTGAGEFKASAVRSLTSVHQEYANMSMFFSHSATLVTETLNNSISAYRSRESSSHWKSSLRLDPL